MKVTITKHRYAKHEGARNSIREVVAGGEGAVRIGATYDDIGGAQASLSLPLSEDDDAKVCLHVQLDEDAVRGMLICIENVKRQRDEYEARRAR